MAFIASSPDKAIAESGLLSELCYPTFHKLDMDYSLLAVSSNNGYLSPVEFEMQHKAAVNVS